MIKSTLVLCAFLSVFALFDKPIEKQIYENQVGLFYQSPVDQELNIPRKIVLSSRPTGSGAALHLIVANSKFTYVQVGDSSLFDLVEGDGKKLRVSVKSGQVLSFNFSDAKVKKETIQIEGEVLNGRNRAAN